MGAVCGMHGGEEKCIQILVGKITETGICKMLVSTGGQYSNGSSRKRKRVGGHELRQDIGQVVKSCKHGNKHNKYIKMAMNLRVQ
jgi:hypothetical protein